MEDFFPETYRLDMRDEREAFFTLFDGERPQDDRSALGSRVKGHTQVGAWSGQGLGPVKVWAWSGRGRVVPGGRSQD